MTKSRGILPPRRAWNADELAVLRELYATTPTKELATRLGRSYSTLCQKAYKLGLKKDPAYLSSPAACRTNGHKGMGTRFAPGQVPWNKGVSGSTGTHPNTARHHFKPGQRPPKWAPLGSLRVVKGPYLQIKVRDTGYTPHDWISYHRHVWEQAHGPLPAGHVVVFRDGSRPTDPKQVTLDRLEMVGRKELLERNSLHTRYPDDLRRIVQLRGVLQRQINRKAKDATQ
jgi:hypothetical protein